MRFVPEDIVEDPCDCVEPVHWPVVVDGGSSLFPKEIIAGSM